MTVNANVPTDQEVVSAWPAWVRESRAITNTIVATSGFAVNNLDVVGGTTSLSVGSDLSAAGHEIIICTGLGAATLATILGGNDGQLKTFVFQDANISILDGIKDSGKFYLNRLPVLGIDTFDQDDVLNLLNVGGDGSAVYGYWLELYRTISIK